MYEVKSKSGAVVKRTANSDEANGWYRYTVRIFGYAEVWHNGECILKTR